jgi:hypothetical protein
LRAVQLKFNLKSSYDKVRQLSAADQSFSRVLRSPPPIILTVKI